ncbi:hypothetical protein FAVG1_00310 [Fusarium avenaceum]|nr:hypothetical protein FAVG1_00310 [Fusarium avenaceum]
MKKLPSRAKSGVPSRASSASRKEKSKKEGDSRKRSNTTDNDSPLPSKRRRQSQVPAETRNTSKDKRPINKSQPTRISTPPPASPLCPITLSPSEPSDDNDVKEEETVEESQAMIVCTLEEKFGASIDTTQDLSYMAEERPRRRAARLSRERIQKAYSTPFGRGDDDPETRPKRGSAALFSAAATDTTMSKAYKDARPSVDLRP